MIEATATYLYCVLKTARPPKGPAPKGLAGAKKPRLIDAGDGYHLVAATAPLAVYSGESIDAKLRDLDWVAGRAAEHEAVVESFAARGTVIPMKLFTLFANDERATEHVRKLKRTLDRVIERIAGCDEWGLRVLFDEARAVRAASASDKRKETVSGTSFLMRKSAQQEQRRVLAARASSEVEGLFSDLRKDARRAVRRPAPNRELAGRVLLDAVFLVPQSGSKKFQRTVATTAKSLAAEGVDVTLTGPWPAYSFIGGK